MSFDRNIQMWRILSRIRLPFSRSTFIVYRNYELTARAEAHLNDFTILIITRPCPNDRDTRLLRNVGSFSHIAAITPLPGCTRRPDNKQNANKGDKRANDHIEGELSGNNCVVKSFEEVISPTPLGVVPVLVVMVTLEHEPLRVWHQTKHTTGFISHTGNLKR